MAARHGRPRPIPPLSPASGPPAPGDAGAGRTGRGQLSQRSGQRVGVRMRQAQRRQRGYLPPLPPGEARNIHPAQRSGHRKDHLPAAERLGRESAPHAGGRPSSRRRKGSAGKEAPPPPPDHRDRGHFPGHRCRAGLRGLFPWHSLLPLLSGQPGPDQRPVRCRQGTVPGPGGLPGQRRPGPGMRLPRRPFRPEQRHVYLPAGRSKRLRRAGRLQGQRPARPGSPVCER